MKKLIPLILLTASSLITGCATLPPDPARRLSRNCPVKYLEGEEASRIASKGFKYTGSRYVYVMDSCWWNANSITSYANYIGIPCNAESRDTKVGRKMIYRGHMVVAPVGSKDDCEYRKGVGVVHFKRVISKPKL